MLMRNCGLLMSLFKILVQVYRGKDDFLILSDSTFLTQAFLEIHNKPKVM